MTVWDGSGSSCRERGEWLVEHRWEMDRGESSWLEALARFDREQGWAVDGQLSAAAWLMWRTQMGRATAFEKLRIAHELARRPVIAAAFAAGRVSYSAVRVITRIEGPDPAVDTALVDLAEAGSVADVERAVAQYQRFADQDRPPPDPASCRGVRIVRHGDGTGRIEITLTDVELEEVAVTLQAFLDLAAEGPDESPRGDSERDESPRGDSGGDWAQRRADAVMAVARTALAHARDGHAVGADRYMVHLVAHDGTVELLDGTVVDVAVAGEVSCDSATVVHLDEPLALGRRTREWSTAQRRAIMVRDGGHCRFPGCGNRIVDIHHRRPWEDGGPTDVANGLLVCGAHHRLLHRGFTCRGDTNGTVGMYRPDGTLIACSSPVRTAARVP